MCPNRCLAPVGGVVLSMLGPIAAAAAGSSAAAPVLWRSGAALLAPAPAGDAAALLAAWPAEAAERRVVTRFTRTIDPEERAALEAAGLRLLAYLGNHTYFATLLPERGALAPLAAAAGLTAIEAVQPQWKLHPLLAAGEEPTWAVVARTPEGEAVCGLYVLLHRDVILDAGAVAVVERLGATVRDTLTTVGGLVIELPLSRVAALAADDRVQWVEPALPPLSELNAGNRARTQADIVQAPPYSLNGAGVTVMVYDGGTARASHQDFGGRLTVRDSSSMVTHATHVAGTIGGSGAASGGLHRGMAPGVTMLSYGFQYSGGGTFLYTNPGDLEADYNQAINTHGAHISNNSIGTNVESNGFNCAIQGDYGVTDVLIDAIVRGRLGAPFRAIWANGNERQGNRCDVEGYGDYYSTAPPAGAKNHITVGAVNSNDDSMTGFSSWGPVDDGRLKPDVSAPGCEVGNDNGVTSCSSTSNTAYTSLCGTSMAAPTVTGLCALLLQDYRVQFPGRPDPRNSTLKILLAHTAVDLGNVGPDYQFGYGSVRIRNAIDFMRQGHFFEGEVGHGGVFAVETTVPPGTTQIKFTLAWDDVPGTPNVIPALVNDLDLRVLSPNGVRHYPWTLNPTNPGAPAVRTQPDRRNNIEQVVVDSPNPGTWRIEIVGFDVPDGPQPFSLCASTPLVFVPAIHISLPGGAPGVVAPGVATPVTVRIRAINDTLIAGSPLLHFRYAGGAWRTQPLAPLGGELYQGVLPPPVCGATPQFYLSAAGAASGPTVSPPGGPTAPYAFGVNQTIVLFSDNFETDLGWTVQNDAALTDGAWQRGVPAGGGQRGDPPTDYDGSGQCYLTGNRPGNSDVDDGTTWLISPTLNLSGGNAVLEYALWYTNNFGSNPNNDYFRTYLSSNNGATWVTAEVIGPASLTGWNLRTLSVGQFITPTSTVRIRFEASDPAAGGGSVVEAAVDAVRITRTGCTAVLPDCNGNGIVDGDDIAAGRSPDVNSNGTPDECETVFVVGDANCDGVVDFDDIDPFVTALGGQAAYQIAFPACRWLNADCNLDGTVNFDDIDAFVALIGS